jgi:hypothetical protein
VATFAIYISAGKVVLQWRRELLKYTHDYNGDVDVSSPSQPSSPAIGKTVEFSVTRGSASTGKPSFQSKQTPISLQSSGKPPRAAQLNINANRAAINYCKCALLFFAALLVTWVPSTVNRVYTLAHPDHPVFGMAYASGLVLPLQGFWNSIIYIFTSRQACKSLMQRISTTLHLDQIRLRRRKDQLPIATDTSAIHGLVSIKPPADRSESVQELHPNKGDGLRILVE